MKSDRIPLILLGIYLISEAVTSFFAWHHPLMNRLFPLWALVTGIWFLLISGRMNRSLGALLLGVWLILKALSPYLYSSIPHYRVLIDLAGFVAGILVLVGK